jgi:uncharacterized protein involved in exopolysaccharide biosynthesis
MDENPALPLVPLSGQHRPTTLATRWNAQRAALTRRRWPMILTFVAVLGVFTTAARLWPPTYESTGTILIEQQEIPEDFVHSVIGSYADQRVQVISQRVMTSANLLAIISKYDLYARLKATRTRERLVDKMRDDIKLKMISADVMDPRQGRPTKATIAFSVSYLSQSPQLAAAVANELTSLYLRENLESRKQQAQGTTDFLNGEAARLGQEVTALQEKIAAFRTDHERSLPEYAQLNIQLINRAQDDLRDQDTRIRALQQQIIYLDGQLAQISPTGPLFSDRSGERVLGATEQLKMLKSEYARAVSMYSDTHPDVIRLRRQIAGMEQEVGSQSGDRDVQRQLEQARADLASSKQNHTPDHPDVVRLSRQVALLQDQLRTMPRSLSTPAVDEKPDNPAYLQAQASRQAAQTELDSLLTQRLQQKSKLDELDRRVSAMPAVARDYDALMDSLQGAEKKHDEVQQKQMEAQLASNLEAERKGERFTLIEPPTEPERPAKPIQLLILLAGFIFSLGAPWILMRLLEALDTRIHGRDDIVAILSVPPLAVVPRLKDLKD